MKGKGRFVVAVKDISSGEIKTGKVLGSYREHDFARQAMPKLVKSTGLDGWRIGIFQNGKCLT